MLVAGRYRLHTPIGRGGMGEVWRATDEVLDRTVAVKLLLDDGSDPSAAARFRLEAQTAARLSHPHVVAVFDFGSWDDRFYLVMEIVEGGSLAAGPEAGEALDASRVATVAAHAAAGLAAAHGQGVVHRDIKPGNLLVDEAGVVKIADFGIAHFLDDPGYALTTAGQIVGTGLYLAPERALGRPASPASDVYSLGCVLYQLLAGRAPFRADTAPALLYQHVDAPPVPPRQLGVAVDPAYEEFLLRLLAKEPADRPTAPQVADWFGARTRAVPEPGPAGPPAADPPRARAAAPPAAPGTTYSLPPAAAPAERSVEMPALSRHRAQARRHLPAQRRTPARDHAAPPVQVPARPQAPSRRRAPEPRRTRVRALARRRPRVAIAAAGTVVFVLALLTGMALFSSGAGGGTGEKTKPGPAATDSPGTGTTAGE